MIPKDPIILLSYVNTQLRDNYQSLDDFCTALDIEKELLISKLNAINYEYHVGNNQFI